MLLQEILCITMRILAGLNGHSAGRKSRVDRVKRYRLFRTVKVGGSIHINEFALENKYRGRKIEGTDYRLSDYLMNDCIDRIHSLRKEVGFSFITLSSTKEQPRSFDGIMVFLKVEE